MRVIPANPHPGVPEADIFLRLGDFWGRNGLESFGARHIRW